MERSVMDDQTICMGWYERAEVAYARVVACTEGAVTDGDSSIGNHTFVRLLAVIQNRKAQIESLWENGACRDRFIGALKLQLEEWEEQVKDICMGVVR